MMHTRTPLRNGVYMSVVRFSVTSRKHQAPLANATEAQEGVIRPLPSDRLQRWNPVRVGFERKLVLDNTGKVFTMRTMAMDPPVFEIGNFLTKRECKYLMKVRYVRPGYIGFALKMLALKMVVRLIHV